MADRILKPDSGNDLVLQNDDGSGKIEINENASIPVTGTLDVSGATLTTSSAQKQAIVQAGPGSGTLDVSSGTFTTSSAQKTAIVDGGKGNLTASDVGLGNVTNESKATMFTSPTFTGNTALGTNATGTFNGTLGTSASGGNSTEFVRNVDVQAMTTSVNTINTSAMTDVATFTYTPKISGTSKVYADLFVHGFTGANRQDTRIIAQVEVTGSGITNRSFNSGEASVFGMYDYGASGMQARFATTILVPRVTSTDTQVITYKLKVQMSVAASSYEIFFSGDANEDQTHIRFMECA